MLFRKLKEQIVTSSGEKYVELESFLSHYYRKLEE